MDPDNRNRSFAQLLRRLQGTDPLFGQDREAVRLFPDYRVRRNAFPLPTPDRIRDEVVQSVDEFLDRGNMDAQGHGNPWPIFYNDRIGLASLGWSELPYEDVELGYGAFGVVHLAFKMQDADQILEKRRFAAVKVQPIREHTVNHMWKEVTILKCVKHPNVVDFYGAFVDAAEPRPIKEGKAFRPAKPNPGDEQFIKRWDDNVFQLSADMVRILSNDSSHSHCDSRDGQSNETHASSGSGSASGSDQDRGAKRKHSDSNWVADKQPRKSAHTSSGSGSDRDRGAKQKYGRSNWVAERRPRKSSHSSEVFRTQPASGSESSAVSEEAYSGCFFMVMEYATAGDMRREILRYPDRRIPESGALYYVKQILSGLQYIHDKGIVHNDLHARNVFLSYNTDGSKRCMLGDFGIASIRGDIDEYGRTWEESILQDVDEVAIITGLMLFGITGLAPPFKPHVSPAAKQVINSRDLTAHQMRSLPWFHGFALAPNPGLGRDPLQRNVRDTPEPPPPKTGPVWSSDLITVTAKPKFPRNVIHHHLATGKSDVQAHWPPAVQILPKNRTTVSRVRHAAPAHAAAPAPRGGTSSPDRVVHFVDFDNPQPGPSGLSPAHDSRSGERSASPMTRYLHQSASRVRHAPSAAAGAPPLRGETSPPHPVVHRVDFANPQPGPSGVSAPPRHQSVPQSRQVTGKGAPRSQSGSPDTRSPQ